MYRLDVKFPFDLKTYVAIGNKITAYVGKVSDTTNTISGERGMQFSFKTKELRAAAAERVRKIPYEGIMLSINCAAIVIKERYDLDPEEEDCGE